MFGLLKNKLSSFIKGLTGREEKKEGAPAQPEAQAEKEKQEPSLEPPPAQQKSEELGRPETPYETPKQKPLAFEPAPKPTPQPGQQPKKENISPLEPAPTQADFSSLEKKAAVGNNGSFVAAVCA